MNRAELMKSYLNYTAMYSKYRIKGFSRKCTNLCNISNWVKGRLDNGVLGYAEGTTELTVNESTLHVVTNSNWRGAVSDYIEIKPNTYYTVSNELTTNQIVIAIAFFDSAKMFISSSQIINDTKVSSYGSILVPSSCKYARLSLQLYSVGTDNITNLQLVEGATVLPYEPYFEGLQSAQFPIKLRGNNLFDVASASNFDNYDIYNNSGITTYKSFKIPCKAGVTYTFSRYGNSGLDSNFYVCLNLDGYTTNNPSTDTWILHSTISSLNRQTITITPKVDYILFTVGTNITQDKLTALISVYMRNVQINEGSIALPYEPYYADYSSLPNEYQEVEYIKSAGNQYIDSEYYHNEKTVIEAMFKTENTTNDRHLFGARQGYNYDFTCWINTSSNKGIAMHLPSGSYSAVDTGFIYKQDIITDYVKLKAGSLFGVSVDNVSYYSSVPVSSFTSPLPLFIFARNQDGSAAGQGKIYLKYFKILENGVVKRHFIPCKKKSNNEYGLYDLVSQSFFGNMGTGAFTGGANVYGNIYVADADELRGINYNLFDKTNYSPDPGYDNLRFDISKLVEGKTYTISANRDIYRIKISNDRMGYNSVNGTLSNNKLTFVMARDSHISASSKQYLYLYTTGDIIVSDIAQLSGIDIRIVEGSDTKDDVVDYIDTFGSYEKNVNEVDLGTLNWIPVNEDPVSRTQGLFAGSGVNNQKQNADFGIVPNYLCSKYDCIKGPLYYFSPGRVTPDISISGGYTNRTIYIQDSRLSEKTNGEVKSSLTNVPLIYELATPTKTSIPQLKLKPNLKVIDANGIELDYIEYK